MKRIACLIVITAIFSFACVATIFAQDSVLKIAAVEGKVLVKAASAVEWSDAKAGQPLNQKDSVKTEDGKALLEFTDKSSVTLKPNTEITVDELVWDNTARKVNINLTAGQLKTILNKVDTPSEFKVKTPTAICGAVGTIFYVIVLPDGTGVYVEEGLIDFLNTLSGQSYTVYQGQRSDAGADGTITEPQTLSADEVNQLIADWGMMPVAEPYSEPGGGSENNANNVVAPEVREEGQASRT